MIYESLETYKNWHLDNNLDYNYKEIDNFLINYEFLKKEIEKKHGGIIEVKKKKSWKKLSHLKKEYKVEEVSECFLKNQ